MTNLSPAAQAVLDAFNNRGLSSREWHDGKAASLKLAAALRAAADQVVPANGSRKNNEIRAEFLAIADKLGALPNE